MAKLCAQQPSVQARLASGFVPKSQQAPPAQATVWPAIAGPQLAPQAQLLNSTHASG
jgi:hypothetical protein